MVFPPWPPGSRLTHDSVLCAAKKLVVNALVSAGFSHSDTDHVGPCTSPSGSRTPEAPSNTAAWPVTPSA